ncbi:hypothetical protein R9X47_24060 [Wukongibacter baidiensis]|uniref:hypothetical protein n=1 Tax=Wukongibacter baidiensis TaxID=1723361 RepID=UPI003D7FCBDC
MKRIIDFILAFFKSIINLTVTLFLITSLINVFVHGGYFNPFQAFIEYLMKMDKISHIMYFLLGGIVDTFRNIPAIKIYQSSKPYDLLKEIDREIGDKAKYKIDLDEGSRKIYIPKRISIFRDKIIVRRIGKHIILKGKSSIVNKVVDEIEELKNDASEQEISYKVLDKKEVKNIKNQYWVDFENELL